MGLLDSLGYGNQGGYGGLLDALLYPSPLTQKPEYNPYAGINTAFDTSAPQPSNPFGAPPQMSAPPASNATFGPVPQLGSQPPQMSAPSFDSFGQKPGTFSQMAPALPPAVNIGSGGNVAQLAPQPSATDFSSQSRQPQMEPAPQQTPPSFLNGGGGFGAGVRGFINNAHTGPIGAILGGLGSAMGMQDPAQQNLKAQYEQLVPLVGQQKAMLAVLNPEAGKTILAQALEKKQYGFTKLDNDTVLRTDPLTGKAELAYGGGRSDTITGPDGKPITIPEGADRKTFVNEVSRANAKAAAGEKTEVQAKSEIFANKMEFSNKYITDGVGTSLTGKIASGVPLGNYAQSADYQKYKQASSNFITALLRQESGAAISKSEFERYDKEYMPQPGDDAGTLAQKSEARRIAIEGMKKGAGPGYKSPTGAPSVIRKYNPATGLIE